MEPKFDSEGIDKTTFAPFVLYDCRETEFQDLRLEFADWEWLHEKCDGDTIDDYYLNGYGVEGLVMAARLLQGLEADPDTMDPNSEGDTCYIHFSDYDEAVQTAEIAARTLKDMSLLRRAVATAHENGFGEENDNF